MGGRGDAQREGVEQEWGNTYGCGLKQQVNCVDQTTTKHSALAQQ